MNILEAIGLLLVGAVLGYAFRAWIGKELVAVKDELAQVKAKLRTRV